METESRNKKWIASGTAGPSLPLFCARLGGALFLVLSLFLWCTAHAAAASQRDLSDPEAATLQEVLASRGLRLAENPEGRKIQNIWVEPLPVFDSDDSAWVRWLNHLRIETRKEVVRQELLVEPGQRFDWSVVEENELLLIQAGFATIVLIVPVESPNDPDGEGVDLLVVTRDFWSLRLSTDFEAAGSVLNYAFLSLTDTNTLGWNKTVQASFLLRQMDADVGVRYRDPNLAGERYVLDLSQGVVLGRTGDNTLEGHYGSARFGLPLYSRRSTFGYDVSASYRKDIYRNLIGRDVVPFEVPWAETDANIPWEYPRFSLTTEILFYRAFGYHYRNIFRFGHGTQQFSPEVPDQLPEGSLTAEIFRRSLESWDQFTSSFIAGYQWFEWRYQRLYNYNTYALAEYVSLGPGFDLETRWANHALLRSDRDHIQFKGSAWWTGELGRDGFYRFSGVASTRLEGHFRSKYLGGGTRWVSPSMGPAGRFVFAGNVDVIVDPVSVGNPLFARGGEAGLRGLVYRSLQGDNFLQSNTEYRTGFFQFLGLCLGGVLFHDMGATFRVGELPNPLHSVGGGVRILILSSNREVLRLDYGVPVNGEAVGFQHGLLTAGFGQAF